MPNPEAEVLAKRAQVTTQVLSRRILEWSPHLYHSLKVSANCVLAAGHDADARRIEAHRLTLQQLFADILTDLAPHTSSGGGNPSL